MFINVPGPKLYWGGLPEEDQESLMALSKDSTWPLSRINLTLVMHSIIKQFDLIFWSNSHAPALALSTVIKDLALLIPNQNEIKVTQIRITVKLWSSSFNRGWMLCVSTLNMLHFKNKLIYQRVRPEVTTRLFKHRFHYKLICCDTL